MAQFGFEGSITTLGHFGAGVSNFYNLSTAIMARKMSGSISYLIKLNAGDKIKIVGTKSNPALLKSLPESVRIRIRKKI